MLPDADCLPTTVEYPFAVRGRAINGGSECEQSFGV